jgi:predicted metal-dependent hydrolase
MTKALLAFMQNAKARTAIDIVAAQLGYRVEHGDAPPADPIDFLVARQPALIVLSIDARSTWRPFIVAAKTSPATRKMPILAITPDDDAALMASAKQAGANVVVTLPAFLADTAGLINKHAKADESAELLRQAQLPLPEMARHAIAQFNAREFFEQHETFEHLWRQEQGPVRQMYQGVLQVGVAYLQIQRGNYAGARKIFQRAWQYLNVLPDVCQGVDVAQFKADAQAALAELERLGPERIAEFPDALFKPVVMASPA